MTPKQILGQWMFSRMPISRFLFEQIRIELNALEVWGLNHLSPAQIRQLRELRAQDNVLVNLGCGPMPEAGFVNLDLAAIAPGVVRWDCRRNLPLSDESAIGIRMEHFFEHVEVRDELPLLLSECLRVLKPGGVLRVIVPDMRKYIEAYLRPDSPAFEDLGVPELPNDVPTKMDMLNHVFHQSHEHRAGYDFENLSHRLLSAGFVDPQQMSYRKSRLPALGCDLAVHSLYSLYVDAVKPARG